MTRWWKFSSGDRLGVLAYRSISPCDISLRMGLDAERLLRGMSSTRRACGCNSCARPRNSTPVIAVMSLAANSASTGACASAAAHPTAAAPTPETARR